MSAEKNKKASKMMSKLPYEHKVGVDAWVGVGAGERPHPNLHRGPPDPSDLALQLQIGIDGRPAPQLYLLDRCRHDVQIHGGRHAVGVPAGGRRGPVIEVGKR